MCKTSRRVVGFHLPMLSSLWVLARDMSRKARRLSNPLQRWSQDHSEVVLKLSAMDARACDRLLDGHATEVHGLAGAKLGEAILVGGDHRRDLWIAAARLVVGKEHNRVSIAGDLECAAQYSFRGHIEGRSDRELYAFETHAHAVIVIGKAEGLREKVCQGRGGEEAFLWTCDEPYIVSRPAEDRHWQSLRGAAQHLAIVHLDFIAAVERP